MSEKWSNSFDYRESCRKKQKFIRYKDGAEIYSMGMSKFQEIAKKAGAIYKINQMVLVNTEILEEYLEQFRVGSDKESIEE